MERRTLLSSVALVATLALQATAQETVNVNVTSPKVPGGTAVIWSPSGFGSFYVSPYTGVLTATKQTIILNCVDFFHDATLNAPYDAYKTDLNDGASALASYTRFGAQVDGLQLYLEAAWLTQQYSWPNPGSNPGQTKAIQAAIWTLFDAYTAATPHLAGGGISDPLDDEYWVDQAQKHYGDVDAAAFYVLTPTDFKSGSMYGQEFLVYNPSAVPEPATLTLLGTGLIFTAGAAKRRRRRNGTTPA